MNKIEEVKEKLKESKKYEMKLYKNELLVNP